MKKVIVRQQARKWVHEIKRKKIKVIKFSWFQMLVGLSEGLRKMSSCLMKAINRRQEEVKDFLAIEWCFMGWEKFSQNVFKETMHGIVKNCFDVYWFVTSLRHDSQPNNSKCLRRELWLLKNWSPFNLLLRHILRLFSWQRWGEFVSSVQGSRRGIRESHENIETLCVGSENTRRGPQVAICDINSARPWNFFLLVVFLNHS